MVLPDSDKITRVPSYSGTDLKFQIFAYETITLYGHTFQCVLLTIHSVMICPTTPRSKLLGLGYTEFARRYYRYLY